MPGPSQFASGPKVGGGTTLPDVPAIGDVLTGTGVGPAEGNIAWLPPVTDNFTITSFQVGGLGALIRAGRTLVNPGGTATYSAVPDGTANSEVVTNTRGVQSPKDISATPTVFAYVGSFAFAAVGVTVTWTLTAHWDSGIFSHARTFTLVSANDMLFGKAVLGSIAATQGFLDTLSERLVSNAIGQTFNENAGATEYIVLAVRSATGPVDYSIGGFTGGSTFVGTISWTNGDGFAENYDLYRSTNPGLGNTDVTVVPA